MAAVPVPALCALFGQLLLAAGYNLDLESWVQYRGPDQSMFGFSVAGYTDRQNSWVLVGAPKANTSQPGVVQGGAVFKCSTAPPTSSDTRYRDCQQIVFDPKGNNAASGQQMDDKSGQWFGALVSTSPGVNNSGVVVACAPRYLWYSGNRKRREPVGTCYVAKNGFQEFDEYSPCRTDLWGYHRQGFCQAGFGCSINEAGDRLFIGAVGSWYWQGRLFTQHLYTRADQAGTQEAPSTEDDSYLGYSVAVGEFSGDDDQDVAVGMPRANNLTGRVLLYTSSLRTLLNISGRQIGAYFGYSLCVADLNGDGRDDVVVGAPFHTDYASTEGKYESGQVVVAYQSADHSFGRFQYLNGRESRSRFGLAVTSLADIDLDGFDDLAVGAPHDGSSDRGAVYIFHGTKRGVSSEPTQVVLASEQGSSLLSFGYSVHGGRDLDNNQYPDLVVGAYDSSAAVYFRSRPVVHVQASVQYQTGKARLLDLTDPRAQCLLDDGRQVPCVSVMFCMTYNGVGVDRRAEFEVELRLDTRRPKSPRLFFREQAGKSRINITARADRAERWCHEQYVYVRDTIRDKLTPLVTEAHYSLVYRKPSRQQGPLQPVLNLDRLPVAVDSLSILKDCGGDDVCVPDLQLAATLSHSMYLLGSSDRLTLNVTVFNKNEDAFEAMFFITLPIGVDYVGAEPADDASSPQVLCSLLTESEDEDQPEAISCDLGNPLPMRSQARFLIHLMPRSTSEELQQDYQFTMTVNSTNAEERHTRADNDVTLTLPIRIHTELLVLGISQPEVVHYNMSRYSVKTKRHEQDVGPELYHVYEISNRGPSEIVSAEAYILWPTYTLPEDRHLLYLLEQPAVEGPGSCDPVPGLNPLQLKLFDRSTQLEPSAPLLAPSLLRPRRSSEAELQAALGCGPTTCTKIYCRIGPLQAEQNVIIRVRSRLWAETVEEERFGGIKEVMISSRLVARVTGLPHQVDPSYMNHTSYTVTSRARSDDLESAPIPWWVIVLASCGGVLILVVLVLILYKIGFFKRNRRPGAEAAGSAGLSTGNGNTSPSYHAYQKVPYNAAVDSRL